MKRILFAAAALMALVGCQKDEVTTPSGTMPKEIIASFEQAGGSRVAADNNGQLTWTAGDQFYLFDKNDNSKKDQYNIKSEGVGQATASFELYGSSQVTEAAYAVYPRVSVPKIDNGKLSLFIDQYAYLPMLAKISQAGNISFKHLCAALRINITEIPEGYTYTIIEASEPISGDFEADLSATEPVLVAIINDMTSYKALYEIDSDSEVVDLPLPVGTYESLTVKIAKDHLGADALTLKSWSNLEVKRAKLYTTSASGQVVDLSQMPVVEAEQVAAVAEAFTEALANPEVEEIKLPENVQLPMTQPITFAAPTASAAASASRAETAATLAGRDITIDGNGGTLVWKGVSGGRIIDVKLETNGMNLTLKNLTIENQTGYTERGVNYNTNGTLTLDNVTIKSAENCAITYAVNLPGSSDNATVEIKNSDICGHIALNLWGENTTVTVTDSTLSNFDNTEVENYAAIVLNNNGTMSAKGSTITVTGGKIIAKDEKGDSWIAVSNPALGTVTIDESTEVTGEILNNVAIVDYGTDNHYGCISLQNAVTKASETAGCTVILLTPIELTETVTVPATADFTLNLNGQTISQTKEQTGAYSMIQNKGKLTIKDSSESKSGVITYTDSGNGGEYVSNTISNSGTLTIESGTIINNCSATVAQNGYPHAIDSSAGLIINGGTITSANYSSIRIWCTTDDDTAVTINGGVFTGAVDLHNTNVNANKGTLTIKGGTFNYNSFTSNYTGTATNAVVRLVNFGEAIENLAINIEGGQFEGGYRLSGSKQTIDFTKVLHISGGSFKVDPSEYVVEGLRAKLIDGVWQIVNAYELQDEADLFWLANEVNVNGKTYEGKTFKLMNDVTLTQDWNPIGSYLEDNRNTLKAAFDGNQKTIKGMTVNGAEYVGFFGAKVKGDVTNLYIDGATISGTHYAGGIVGWMHNVAEVGHNAVLNVKGCKVTNSNITLDTDATPDNGDKAGGIVGFIYLGTIDGCSVANTNIKAYRDCGGIVGFTSTYQNGSTNYYPNVSNNTVGENVKLTVDNDQNYKNYTVQGDYDFDHIIGDVGTNTVAESNSGTVTIEWGAIPAE